MKKINKFNMICSFCAAAFVPVILAYITNSGEEFDFVLFVIFSIIAYTVSLINVFIFGLISFFLSEKIKFGIYWIPFAIGLVTAFIMRKVNFLNGTALQNENVLLLCGILTPLIMLAAYSILNKNVSKNKLK